MKDGIQDVTKYVGKLWGIDRRRKNKQKVHVNIWSIFLSFQITGIICSVHNTDAWNMGKSETVNDAAIRSLHYSS